MNRIARPVPVIIRVVRAKGARTPCNKKLLLAEQYAEAADLFSRAVKRLLLSVHDESAFDPAGQAAHRAREKCNLACLALDTHRGQHGC